VIEKLSGYKTYIAVVCALAWTLVYLKVPGARDAIGSDNFLAGLASILAAGGISMRAAQAKAAQDVADGHESLKTLVTDAVAVVKQASPAADTSSGSAPAPSDASAKK
jgi:hypothetical protein